MNELFYNLATLTHQCLWSTFHVDKNTIHWSGSSVKNLIVTTLSRGKLNGTASSSWFNWALWLYCSDLDLADSWKSLCFSLLYVCLSERSPLQQVEIPGTKRKVHPTIVNWLSVTIRTPIKYTVQKQQFFCLE